MSNITESVLNRAPPVWDWKQSGKFEEQDYEGGIYQPPPVIKHVLGYVRYHMAARSTYDETQRKFVPPEVERAMSDLTFWEKVRHVLTFKAGMPMKTRPFPWRDAYERSGHCPEEYMGLDWRQPRRTFFNKYVPPPKDGVYEDMFHVREHANWVYREWWVYRNEIMQNYHNLIACSMRHPNTYGVHCRSLIDLHYNMIAKTNMDKVKMMLWSGQQVIRDGGFKVRY